MGVESTSFVPLSPSDELGDPIIGPIDGQADNAQIAANETRIFFDAMRKLHPVAQIDLSDESLVTDSQVKRLEPSAFEIVGPNKEMKDTVNNGRSLSSTLRINGYQYRSEVEGDQES